MVTVSRYPGGFIGEPAVEKAWIAYEVKGCTDSVEVMAGVARRHPQTSYADMKKSLQQ